MKKRIWVVSLSLMVLIVFVAACGRKPEVNPNNPLTGKVRIVSGLGLTKEVLPDVFDTGNGTVFIGVNKGLLKRSGDNTPDEVVADLIAKKEAWQKMFPEKKIVAMTEIARDAIYYGVYTGFQSVTSGILIHYEQ